MVLGNSVDGRSTVRVYTILSGITRRRTGARANAARPIDAAGRIVWRALFFTPL